FAVILGCASTETKEFARQLNPLVGHADKAYFIEKYGQPDRRSTLDSQSDVWEYRFSGENLNAYGTRGNLSTATLLRLTFRNGTLSAWQATNTLR
ncbi:MAG: hypothetical protein ABI039_10485, partial [Vicinamibacterales bacterium]